VNDINFVTTANEGLREVAHIYGVSAEAIRRIEAGYETKPQDMLPSFAPITIRNSI
jgi:glycine cleavage system aminomethyltransferase T